MSNSRVSERTVADGDVRTERLKVLYSTLRRVVRAVYFRPNASSALMEMPILQVRCLNSIAEQEGQRMVDVAARANIGLPGASRTVDRLVRMCLVIREQDPQDR